MFGVILAWLVSLPQPDKRMGPKRTIDAVYTGIKGVALVCVACATAGIILACVSLSGIGPKLVAAVLAGPHGIPFIALFLVMIVSLVLGVGLPTTGAYILASALGVPILTALKFPALAAHMFVFYFAIISNITPPVALAAYAGASIAGSDPNKTGFTACKLGFLAFIAPFAFCYDPGILLQSDLVGNLFAIFSCVIGCFGFGFTLMGYINRKLKIYERLILCVFSVMAMTPYETLTLVGAAGVIVVSCLFAKTGKKKPPVPAV